MSSPKPFDLRPLTPTIGAEITGVDLSQPIDGPLFEAIEAALLEHEVIFFRDQDLSGAQQKAFASLFGPLQTHPAYPHVEGHPEVTILHHTRERPSKIEVWHTDMTFRANPPLGSVLHARLIPPHGGDTLWSSMSAAYDALSAPMKRLLSGLRARHDFAHGFKESLAEPGGYERLKPALEANPPVEHPVIRVHPRTGRRGIFVNKLFTTGLVGLPEAESRALLDFLFAHVVRAEFTCRFRWSPGAVAFWDNRITQHVPINDYWPEERCMHRVVIDGDIPYGPDGQPA